MWSLRGKSWRGIGAMQSVLGQQEASRARGTINPHFKMLRHPASGACSARARPPCVVPQPPQGASPQELRQKVNSAATAGAVLDDPDGFGSWDLGAHPAAVDLSTTPNRLLYSLLPSQATLTPGVLEVAEAAAAPLTVALALSAAPTADVTVT